MLIAALCVGIVFIMLLISELLWRAKILQGEWMRKSVHASIAAFVAFWPWLISWNYIKLIALAFLAGALINRLLNFFHMLAGLRQSSIGDINFAIAILASAVLTDVKIFFCLAILQLALADSLAALAGQKWGSRWQYQVLGQLKTVVGTMAFWIVSFLILGIGGLFAHNNLDYGQYLLVLAVLPPILTILENLSILGADNLTVPIATVVALNLITG